MKYLVLVLVIVAVLWIARSRVRKPPPRRAPPPAPQDIVACAHCGVHLPSAEAVSGADGVYCSEAHRLAHDRKAG